MTEREKDELQLKVLHLKLNTSHDARDIRKASGMTNGAIQGLMRRIRSAHAPCECEKPENKDGGMPVCWWMGAA